MRWVKFFVLVWMVKDFWTEQGVADFLNSLPPARALEAKVSATDLTQPFYVFYRAEKL